MTYTIESVTERFKDHKIDIQFDDAGNNRIIRLHKDDSYNDLIYITTWKNGLSYSGDLGSFIFSHPNAPDMLRLFRGDMSASYWRESLKAGQALEFDRDSGMELLKGHVMDWYKDLDEDQLREFEQEDLEDMLDDIESDLWNIENEPQFYDYVANYSNHLHSFDLGIFDFSSLLEEYGSTGCSMKHTARYELACHVLHVFAWRLQDAK